MKSVHLNGKSMFNLQSGTKHKPDSNRGKKMFRMFKKKDLRKKITLKRSRRFLPRKRVTFVQPKNDPMINRVILAICGEITPQMIRKRPSLSRVSRDDTGVPVTEVRGTPI